MKLPSTAEEALTRTERDSMWLRKRFPDTDLSRNEAHASYAVFLSYVCSPPEIIRN
jgi:hypothetical protein